MSTATPTAALFAAAHAAASAHAAVRPLPRPVWNAGRHLRPAQRCHFPTPHPTPQSALQRRSRRRPPGSASARAGPSPWPSLSPPPPLSLTMACQARGRAHRQATARTREVRRAGPGSNAAAHLSMSSLRLAQVAQAPPVAADERQRSPQATATARRLLLGANLQICAQHHAGPSDMYTHLNSEQARSGRCAPPGHVGAHPGRIFSSCRHATRRLEVIPIFAHVCAFALDQRQMCGSTSSRAQPARKTTVLDASEQTAPKVRSHSGRQGARGPGHNAPRRIHPPAAH